MERRRSNKGLFSKRRGQKATDKATIPVVNDGPSIAEMLFEDLVIEVVEVYYLSEKSATHRDYLENA